MEYEELDWKYKRKLENILGILRNEGFLIGGDAFEICVYSLDSDKVKKFIDIMYEGFIIKKGEVIKKELSERLGGTYKKLEELLSVMDKEAQTTFIFDINFIAKKLPKKAKNYINTLYKDIEKFKELFEIMEKEAQEEFISQLYNTPFLINEVHENIKKIKELFDFMGKEAQIGFICCVKNIYTENNGNNVSDYIKTMWEKRKELKKALDNLNKEVQETFVWECGYVGYMGHLHDDSKPNPDKIKDLINSIKGKRSFKKMNKEDQRAFIFEIGEELLLN